MLFGLKNAGAFFQRLMQSTFSAQLGRNLEAYVGDLVVKSIKKLNHISDLQETFDNLRKHRLKLNPEKCVRSLFRKIAWVPGLCTRNRSKSRKDKGHCANAPSDHKERSPETHRVHDGF